MRIDDTDRRLLRRFLAEPDLSIARLAEFAGVTQATASRRIERMTREGVIRGQHAVIDWTKLGYAVEVSLRFTLEKSNPRAFDEFMASAREVPEVTQIQTFLGKVDVRLHVVARDMAHYQQIYRTRILTLPHIADIEALMQVARVLEKESLPL
ncbi:Lrp/AsnC family transcriptional regulator [Maritimibacter sp. DP1N21-5]|uniref:Lrp/AsnC family transcriptional regulator n=1 Tax=Maritimibacter sp. DP1N21-5 TaxID=2836867 RepID=UPI001C47C9D8|nr:Lrp/AsnC family transcriptional regulator [Maritimibacter sp. DP1N21-5]MBV7410377.1 Lrp/AsnC family transcriptional regulator [Maritimibacter sp. DP1N21-5]